MINELTRDYPGTDWYLMEQSQTLKDFFDDDVADFEAFDTSLNAAFGNAWQTLIDKAVNYKDDTTVSAELGTQTDKVDEAMQACRNMYMDIIYFAEQAFGANSPVLRQFGKGNAYKQASNAQGRMFDFMDELSQTAVSYQAELVAAGCPAATIANIATVRDAFKAANRTQNKSVKGRPVITQDRLKAYNDLYAATRKVIDAAQRVYRNNAAKLGLYAYNPVMQHGDTTESLDFTLAPNEVKVIAQLTFDAARALSFKNTGATTIRFGLSTTADFPAGGFVTLALNSQAGTTMGNMGTEGTFLLAQNTEANPGSGQAEWDV